LKNSGRWRFTKLAFEVKASQSVKENLAVQPRGTAQIRQASAHWAIQPLKKFPKMCERQKGYNVFEYSK